MTMRTALLAAAALAVALAPSACRASTYTVSSGDCGNAVVLAGPYTVDLPAASGFPTNCSVSVCNSAVNAPGGRSVTLFTGSGSAWPAPLSPRLYMGQCASVKNVASAWVATGAPGRFRPNGFTPKLYVDSVNGSDQNDGYVSNAVDNAMATPSGAREALQNEYDFGTTQPVVYMTCGQVFPPVLIDGPLTGTSVWFLGGNGSPHCQATIQAASSGTYAFQSGDTAPWTIFSDVTLDCSTSSAACSCIFLHQNVGIDVWTDTVCKGGGDYGVNCDSMAKTNWGSDGSTPSFAGTMAYGFNGQLGCQFVVSAGVNLANGQSMTAAMLHLQNGAGMLWTGPINIGSSVTSAVLFDLMLNSSMCASGVTATGSFSGTAPLQFQVFGNSVMANITATPLPGSAGIVSYSGYAPGFAPDAAGGNLGYGARSCG